MNKLKQILKNDTVLCLALLLACVSSFFYTPSLSYIDFDVLCVLLALMLVVAGLKSINFLDWLALKMLNSCQSNKQVALALVSITYISSMFVTNDVALLTFVPLALVIGRTLALDMERVIIMQTLAANLGSMLTPPGNPQNLFLFAHYHYTAGSFFSVMLLPCALSVIYLLVLLWRMRSISLQLALPALACPPRGRMVIFLSLLALNIAAVLHLVAKPWALMLTVVLIFVLERSLFKQIDYSLLVTFSGFFIFIGNISHSSITQYLQQSLLGTSGGTYFAGLLASQFISNVPAAMLLAGLTQQADALLLGVNIGGLGTLIASMASVISYKLFVSEHPAQAGRYLRTFLYYNFMGLLLIGAAVYYLSLF